MKDIRVKLTARAIDGLTEWQKHVQTDSNINRDITVAIEALKAQFGTNLAEVGTDCISRQQAINALRDYLVEKRCPDDGTLTCRLIENEVINKLPSATDKNVGDTISRKAMIDALHTWFRDGFDEDKWWNSTHVLAAIEGLPPVTPKQPDLSEAYANAVFTWLMSYQIQSAQLKGRYTPYEVIGWVLNDWRKEHDAERDT